MELLFFVYYYRNWYFGFDMLGLMSGTKAIYYKLFLTKFLISSL